MPERPRVEIDHVLIAVPDLTEGARSIRRLRLGDPNPAEAARRLERLLGGEIAAVATVEAAETPGVLAVEVDTPAGTVVIR